MSHSSAAYNAVMSLDKIGIGAKSKLTLKQQQQQQIFFICARTKKSILYDTSLRRRRPADVGVRSIAMMTDL